MEIQYEQTKTQNQTKKPADVFKHCPHCKSHDQFELPPLIIPPTM